MADRGFAGDGGRAMRSDARRNEAKIRQAAVEVFRQQGLDAPLEAVVQRAGVSTGTLYNHFRNRRNLLDAVFPEIVTWTVSNAVQRALRSDDPWERFERLVVGICEFQIADRRFAEMVFRFIESGRFESICEQTREEMEAIIVEAQRQGVVRVDVSIEDLLLVIVGIGVLVGGAATAGEPEAWRRYIGLMLDGVRADRAGTLDGAPMGTAQTLTVMRGMSLQKRVLS